MPGVSFGFTLAPMFLMYESSFSWGTLHPQPFNCRGSNSGNNERTCQVHLANLSPCDSWRGQQLATAQDNESNVRLRSR